MVAAVFSAALIYIGSPGAHSCVSSEGSMGRFPLPSPTIYSHITGTFFTFLPLLLILRFVFFVFPLKLYSGVFRGKGELVPPKSLSKITVLDLTIFMSNITVLDLTIFMNKITVLDLTIFIMPWNTIC